MELMRENRWNGTFIDGWNFWEGRGVERNFWGRIEQLLGGKKGGTELLGMDGTFGREGGLNRTPMGWMELMGGKKGGTEL
jgi:hypothetical protein